MVAEEMANALESDMSADEQNSSLLAADDDKRESYTTVKSSHIEVPVGSLSVPGEEQIDCHGSATEDYVETGECAIDMDQNSEVNDNGAVSEREFKGSERQQEAAVTSMSIQVRSGVQMADQVSVACGDGDMSEDTRDGVKCSSPVLQYSSDAAATGLFFLLQKIKSYSMLKITECCACT